MILIVLPIFNEGPNINELLDDIQWHFGEISPQLNYKIVVVNDGSDDNSSDILYSLLSDANYLNYLIILNHDHNKGLSESLKTGLKYCIDWGADKDIVITMDGDNTHTPGLIFSMLNLLHQGNDVVVASRYIKGARVIGVPMSRKVLSYFASILFRIFFPIPNIKDYTSGYRAYKLNILKKSFKSFSEFISQPGFSCMVDILLKIRKISDFPIMREVPLILRYDKKFGNSKMNVRSTTFETIILIIKRFFGNYD